jgi:hypothetical protein
MNIKYVNHNGKILNLAGDQYVINFDGIFDYDWQYKHTSFGSRGGRITKFYRDMLEKTVKIYVKAKTQHELDQNLRSFFETVEADVLETIPGRLVLDTEEYLICYLIASKKTLGSGVSVMICGAKIVTEIPFWCRDVLYHYGQNVAAGSPEVIIDPFLDYMYDYDYDYSSGTNVQTITNDFIAGTEGSHFEMTIYGYAEQPIVTIGDHPYQVHVTAQAAERIVIDSRTQTVKLHKPNGEIENIYRFRDKENSVFALIPPGVSTVSANAMFDLVIYQERSEPRWNL